MAIIDNLISYWKLDEASGNAIDAHSSNDGTATNITYGGTGKIGDAFEFNGSSSKVNVGSDASLDNIFAGGGSISVWLYAHNYGQVNNGRVIVKSTSTGLGDGWTLQTRSTNSGVAFAQANDSGGINGRWTATMGLNAWHHVVVTYDNSSNDNDALIYIDGSEIGTEIATPTGTPDDDSAIDIIIGAVADTREFDGLIDEMGIWDKILSSSEVTSLYNSGDGLAYPFSVVGVIRKIKISGTFQDKPIKTKVGGTFVDKPIKIKVGGTFQDA